MVWLVQNNFGITAVGLVDCKNSASNYLNIRTKENSLDFKIEFYSKPFK